MLQEVSFAAPLHTRCTTVVEQGKAPGGTTVDVEVICSRANGHFHVKSTKYMKLECIGKGGSSKSFVL